jgi:signal transduction histidine kinase
VTVWREGRITVVVEKMSPESMRQWWHPLDPEKADWLALEPLMMELTFTLVPFQYGTVNFRVQTVAVGGLTTVQALTEALSLGYVRFLDFQRLKEQAESLQQQAEQARRERAVERIRAEAMAMRGSDDLLKVVAVLLQEMNNLGIDTPQTSIVLIDEERDQWITYTASTNPEKFGLSWSSPKFVEYDKNTIVGITGQSSVKDLQDDDFGKKTFEYWKRDEVHLHEWTYDKSELAEQTRKDMGLAEDESFTDSILERIEGKSIVDIPFEYGVIGFFQQGRNEEQEAIVRELAGAFTLGYLRFLDFQRLEEQNQTLEEANLQIQQATQRKSAFLASMSHDLRTPMNAIIGYTRILMRRTGDRLDDREQRNLQNIETSSNNLLNLINEILDLSRIEAGRVEVKVAEVDVQSLAQTCAVSIAPLVKDGVEFHQELQAVPTLATDGDLLQRVLMNLLGNAVKFTESGRITLSVQPVEDDVEVSVADTGVGIPEEDLPYIFEEFRQVDREGGAEAQGSGLGLAIVKKTVELLGGTITAYSEEGRGTTFTFTMGNYAG